MSKFSDLTHQYTNGLSWSHPTWDLFILVFLCIGTIIYGFSLGRNRIIMIMVAIYMALVAVTYLPIVPHIAGDVLLTNGFVIKISTFLGLFAILFFMLTRSALSHAMVGDGALGRWWQIILLSFLQMGMLISVVMSFLPEQWLSHLATLTRLIFISNWGKFVWVVLPIFGLMIVGVSNERDMAHMRYER